MKIAIVGTGYYAQHQIAAWIRIPTTKLVGVVDLDLSKARASVQAWPKVSAFNDINEMLKSCKPDVVDIVTPEATHEALINQLSGKVQTIICQKPLAPTIDAARRMVETASSRGTTLYVHENFRYQPWFVESHRLIASGLLGVPQQLTFRFRPGDGRGPAAYRERQPYFRNMTRFLVHETVIHYTDTFRYLLGEVSNVTAKLRHVNPTIAGEDAGIVIYEFVSGAVAVLDGNRDLDHEASEPRYTHGNMLLEGSQAALRLDGDGRLWIRQRGAASETLHREFERRLPNGDCVFGFQSAVANAIGAVGGANSTGENSCRAESYLRNLEIEDAIYQSSSERRTVDL